MIDWAVVEAWMIELRQQNEQSIALRRGNSTLAAQPMRVERSGVRAQDAQSTGAAEQRETVSILGGKALNIAVDDRFTVGGVLYRVEFVHPNRNACTHAAGVAVE